MKRSKRRAEIPRRPAPEPRPPEGGLRWWHYALGLLATLLILLEVYQPALRGPFVFDDQYLPFADPQAAQQPLRRWVAGVRPLLMASFWANYRLSEMEPYSYHLFNVLLHWVSGWLVFLVVRRLLERAGATGAPRELLAAFAGGVFLWHPLQTESVAYVASRSEALSGMFLYAALALFLYRRREAVSWPVAAGVMLLFGAAVSTKEHTAVLPVLLLGADYFFNPGFSFRGIRRNWRLYVPIAAAGVLALLRIWDIVRASGTTGFALKEFTWYQYFFTQCRVIWIYIRLFLLPYGQTIDYNLPVSRTLLEHGAVLGLAALLLATAAAFVFRRRYPLAAFGFFAFLLLLAPTSSVVPIADPIAERRMYLPLLGLLLVAVEFLRRWKARRVHQAAALTAVLVVAGLLTYSRNQAWGSDVALWEDAAAKSPGKQRIHFQLGFAYFKQGRCEDAARHYEMTARLARPDYRLYYNLALAYACLGRAQEARENLLATLEDCRRALKVNPQNDVARQVQHMAEARLGLAR